MRRLPRLHLPYKRNKKKESSEKRLMHNISPGALRFFLFILAVFIIAFINYALPIYWKKQKKKVWSNTPRLPKSCALTSIPFSRQLFRFEIRVRTLLQNRAQRDVIRGYIDEVFWMFMPRFLSPLCLFNPFFSLFCFCFCFFKSLFLESKDVVKTHGFADNIRGTNWWKFCFYPMHVELAKDLIGKLVLCTRARVCVCIYSV